MQLQNVHIIFYIKTQSLLQQYKFLLLFWNDTNSSYRLLYGPFRISRGNTCIETWSLGNLHCFSKVWNNFNSQWIDFWSFLMPPRLHTRLKFLRGYNRTSLLVEIIERENIYGGFLNGYIFHYSRQKKYQDVPMRLVKH